MMKRLRAPLNDVQGYIARKRDLPGPNFYFSRYHLARIELTPNPLSLFSESLILEHRVSGFAWRQTLNGFTALQCTHFGVPHARQTSHPSPRSLRSPYTSFLLRSRNETFAWAGFHLKFRGCARCLCLYAFAVVLAMSS